MLRISHVSIIIALLNVPRSWLRVFAIRLVGSAMFIAIFNQCSIYDSPIHVTWLKVVVNMSDPISLM